MKGTSDPISYTCTCPATLSPDGGLVLLFYRYYSCPPLLSPSHPPLTSSPSVLANWHLSRTTQYQLSGKIRIAAEGYNLTVGGTTPNIKAYIQDCISHWSFSNLGLENEDRQREFFKPSKGCACVFGGGPANIKITAESTPMGVTNYSPKNWDSIETLTPEEFHARCWKEEVTLLDVRNHYESRIGYFIDPKTGEAAMRPGIRRFSQFPQYVRRWMNSEGKKEEEEEGRNIMTYCTGGIRCEKGVRYMAENMERREGDKICTLRGGIAAYLMWMDEEIKAGRKKSEDSLFRGKNYVFDARGSMGLSEETQPVATCHVCEAPEDRLSKCRSKGCHLVLVVCEGCEKGDPRCCRDCLDLDTRVITTEDEKSGPRPICMCEKARETQLWGGERVKVQKIQGSRKVRGKTLGYTQDIDIQIKTID